MPTSRTGRKGGRQRALEAASAHWSGAGNFGLNSAYSDPLHSIGEFHVLLGTQLISEGGGEEVEGREAGGIHHIPSFCLSATDCGFGNQGLDTDVHSASTPRQDSFSGCAELTSDFVGAPLATCQVRGTNARHAGIQS